jgi:glycogen(starch) synthase
MHILVTADTLGGVWTYTRELVTGLVRRGDRVTLVSFGDIPTAAQTRWMDGLANLDYLPTAFKLEWMLDSEADMEASSQYLQAIIQESRPDLLHFSQFYYGALNCDVPRIVVAHSDVVSWWMSVHRQSPPETDWLRWYRQIVARGLHEATSVVAPSRWMLEQIELHYGNLVSSSVIHNGRTPTLFNPYISKQETIVTVGRLWDSGKNVSLLLRQEMPGSLHIVGCDRHPDLQNHAFMAETIRPNVSLDPQQDDRQIVQTLARAGI